VAAAAKMTWIVGDASSKFKESLTVNGSTPAGVNSTNPFGGTQGGGWSALTFPVSDTLLGTGFSVAPLGESAPKNASAIGYVETKLTPGDSQSTCLSFGVVMFSALVQNKAKDGILNVWKTDGLHFKRAWTDGITTFGTCADYPSEPCVDLNKMVTGGITDL